MPDRLDTEAARLELRERAIELDAIDQLRPLVEALGPWASDPALRPMKASIRIGIRGSSIGHRHTICRGHVELPVGQLWRTLDRLLRELEARE